MDVKRLFNKARRAVESEDNSARLLRAIKLKPACAEIANGVLLFHTPQNESSLESVTGKRRSTKYYSKVSLPL